MTTGKVVGRSDWVVVRHVVGVEAAQSIEPVRSCGMTRTLKRNELIRLGEALNGMDRKCGNDGN